MGRGKRYDGEQKLNIKKVVATVLVLVVLIMLIVLIVKFIKKGKNNTTQKNITNSYISVFTNGKWGVINSKGEYVLEPKYDNMITIPNASKDIFFIQENVDLEKGTFTSKAINSKETTLFNGYENVEPVQRIDKSNVVSYDDNVFKV